MVVLNYERGKEFHLLLEMLGEGVLEGSQFGVDGGYLLGLLLGDEVGDEDLGGLGGVEEDVKGGVHDELPFPILHNVLGVR